MTSPRKSAKISAEMALIAGIQKHLSSTSFMVLSQPETTAQVVALIQSRVDADQGTLAAKTGYHQAVVTAEALNVQTDPFVRDVRQTILGMFSNSPQILGDFALAPRKTPTPLTSEQKVIASAKRKATRAARHTAGKRQKAAIQGTLGGPVVVQPDGTSSVDTSGPTTPAAPLPAPAGSGSSSPHE
jgi:hypothetical protein